MKLRTLLLGFILGLLPITAMAGSGHDHGHSHSNAPVNQATATTTATTIVAEFVKRKKLDESWTSITAISVEKKEYKDSSEWVISFVNDKITDPDKRTLYVFLTLTGDYIAANYTGK
ncbi:MAG: hypothetical protein KAS48_06090 [Gammaproteobacteria bacterium]|nr:hypothetical protein [Gammaproteobacteria bacterium]